jgi:hypothetical protein
MEAEWLAAPPFRVTAGETTPVPIAEEAGWVPEPL